MHDTVIVLSITYSLVQASDLVLDLVAYSRGRLAIINLKFELSYFQLRSLLILVGFLGFCATPCLELIGKKRLSIVLVVDIFICHVWLTIHRGTGRWCVLPHGLKQEALVKVGACVANYYHRSGILLYLVLLGVRELAKIF